MTSTLELKLVQSEADYNALGLVLESRLGKGSYGITFKAKYQGKDRAVKFLKSHNGDGRNELKEAVLGFEVKKRVPGVVKEFFTEVFAFIMCRNVVLPPRIIDKKNYEAIVDTLEGVDEFYIIVQEFIADGEVGSSWVSKADKLNGDVIRSIMFQLTLALTFAQSVIGFQHNDLKLQNIMFVENKTGKDIVKRISFLEGDVFEYTIPSGGVSVRIIDLGSSALVGTGIEPNYIGGSLQVTPGYAPLDFVMLPNYGTNMNARYNDSDIQGLYKIMVNLVMHKRLAQPNGSVWNLVSTEDDTIDYTEYDWTGFDQNVIDTSTNSLNDVASAKTIRFDHDGTKILVMELLLLSVLGISIELPKTWKGSALGPVAQGRIQKVFNIVTKDEFLQPYKESITYMANTVSAVNDAFPDGMGLHFLKLLGKPFHVARLSFGLPEPFDTYSLANAIFHPFFAYGYWKNDNAGGAESIGIYFDGPLLTQDDAAKKAVPTKLADAYLAAFEKLQKTSAPPGDAGATPPPSVAPKKTRGKSTKTDDTSEGTEKPKKGAEKPKKGAAKPPPKTYKEWDDDRIAWLNANNAKTLDEKDLLGLTNEQLRSIDYREKELLDVLITKFGGAPPDKKSPIATWRDILVEAANARRKQLGMVKSQLIYERLETIEHLPEFASLEQEDAFDVEAIHAQLYAPICQAVAEHPELSKAAEHLGLGEPLFQHRSAVDMRKRSNQVRYLHTLSILAEMIESHDVTPEKIERCFTEWPPAPQYRVGEVNEI
jgi:serine/threonine protein kinase